MTQIVASYQVSAFVTPTNATTADADQVRGNDNAMRAAFNSHDADATIHLQSSELSARPAAGILGRSWLTTDEGRVYYDDGANWLEIAYVRSAGGSAITCTTLTLTGATITGPVGGLTVTVPSPGNLTLTSANGNVAINTGGGLGTLTLQGGGGVSITGTNTQALLKCTSGDTKLEASNGVISFATLSTVGTAQLRWKIDGSGHFQPQDNGQYDIGTTLKTVRNLYMGLTGWGNPTGSLVRTTFATGTVTTEQLAQRVAALINDLLTRGFLTA